MHRKKAIAKSKLGREPNHEEIILEYKGMLKSKTDLKKKALENYRERSVLFLFVLSGCSISSFKIKKETDSLTELLVTPDRITLQCEELDEDPDVGAYGFMVHILDKKKTVTTSALSIRPDKENCERFIQKIGRILKDGKQIYVGSRSKLSNQSRTAEDTRFRYVFLEHGTFFSNGRSLEFVVIANEKGQCYAPTYGKDELCPPFPFPIENTKKNK